MPSYQVVPSGRFFQRWAVKRRVPAQHSVFVAFFWRKARAQAFADGLNLAAGKDTRRTAADDGVAGQEQR